MTVAVQAPNLSFLDNKSVSLPALPGVAVEVIRLTRSDDVDIDELIAAVSRDPALAARLLRLSNSSMFGATQQVTTIAQAVMLLGVKSVKVAALSFSLVPMLGTLGTEEDDDAAKVRQDFWLRALGSAVAAREILRRRKNPLSDEGFLCGLLMDLGVPILCQYAAKEYAPVLETMESGHPDVVREFEIMGASHAEVSSRLLERWNLPRLVTQPIADHHTPDAVDDHEDPRYQELVRTLYYAHLISTVLSSEVRRGSALDELRIRGASWFGLDEVGVDGLIEELVAPICQMAELMDVDIGEQEEIDLILAQAREDLLTLTVGTNMELLTTQKRVTDLEKKVTTDALTGINNRAFFDEIMTAAWDARCKGMSKTSLSVIMVDVDHFKNFNDTYGHQAGDEVLKAVAQTLSSTARETDHVCRYGGEEFAVVIEAASMPVLRDEAEKLRAGLEAMTVSTDQGELKVTASFGAAIVGTLADGMTPEGLIQSADANLYKAKETGRNRVVTGPYLRS